MRKRSNSQFKPQCSAAVNAVVRPLEQSQPTLPNTHHSHQSHTQAKLTSQKLLKTQRNIPIPILIILFKDIRHPLQNDTTLHKQIKAHLALPAFVIRRIHQFHKRRRKPISKRNQRIGVFVKGNVTAAVFVESVKESAPGGEEGP